ncbi:hypothetical protein [Aquimarina sp. LLG6339-5]|uniref:hypothetical protein n=1 Tax=Aquimarina sp. LLG6339-5 TaxID=3160830 RepID=UPI0038673716
MKIISLFTIIMTSLFLFSCKYDKINLEKESIKINKKTPVQDKKKEIDLLKYKKNEKSFNESPVINLTSVNINFLKDIEYKFVAIGKTNISIDSLINDYYAIINIYPSDEDMELIDEKRKKYRFETFSTKIRKTQNGGDIMIGRSIKTKLSDARAFVITIFKYKDKKRIQEILMENVDLD